MPLHPLSTAMAGSDSVAGTIVAWLHEFTAADGSHTAGHDQERTVSRAETKMSFRQFMLFMAQQQLLRWSFDHSEVMSAFRTAVDARIESAKLELEAEQQELEPMLDAKMWRQALQAVACMLYGHQHGISKTSNNSAEQNGARLSCLRDMVRDVHLRQDAPFNPAAALGVRGLLYSEPVLRAVYEYSTCLRGLFTHYAVETGSSLFGSRDNTSVIGRSVYRLCRAIRFVPDCLVAGELCEVAQALRSQGWPVTAQETRYFDEESMTPRYEDHNWLLPVRAAVAGEPCYSFPEFVELLAAAALHEPPRLHKASVEARIGRIHKVFGERLRFPRHAGSFDAHLFLAEPASGTKNKAGDSLQSILTELHAELPALPKQVFELPQPSEAQLSSLKMQQPTAEELIERTRLEAQAKKPGKKSKPMKLKAIVKEKAGPVVFDKVSFLGKRPEPSKFGVPPQRVDYRYENLEMFQRHVLLQSQQAQAANASSGGWALRMSLIDEPLRAPPCEVSEEVSTLIETALASRRLRHYAEAITLLIRGRTLWASLKAGHKAPFFEPRPPSASAPAKRPSRSFAPATVLDVTLLPQGCEPSAPLSGRSDGAEAASRSRREGAFSLAKGDLTHHASALEDRRYNPKTDFLLAAGDGEDHLQLLSPEAGLFFLCELASLHSAIQEDDLAAQLLWRARRHSDKLPSSHPDTAVVWCGLGRVAYHAGEFEVAAQATARARAVRERTLGGDTIETATTYNNLACCLTGLDRSMEAVAYMDIAVAILSELAGEDHPRTLTAMRNLEKVRTSAKHFNMEVPHIYSLPVKGVDSQFRKKKSAKKKGGEAKSGKKKAK